MQCHDPSLNPADADTVRAPVDHHRLTCAPALACSSRNVASTDGVLNSADSSLESGHSGL
jgi:hypothetical protein